jgi:hypothetical protein
MGCQAQSGCSTRWTRPSWAPPPTGRAPSWALLLLSNGRVTKPCATSHGWRLSCVLSGVRPCPRFGRRTGRVRARPFRHSARHSPPPPPPLVSGVGEGELDGNSEEAALGEAGGARGPSPALSLEELARVFGPGALRDRALPPLFGPAGAVGRPALSHWPRCALSHWPRCALSHWPRCARVAEPTRPSRASPLPTCAPRAGTPA